MSKYFACPHFLQHRKNFFFKYFSFVISFNVFLPPTVFESLKSLTVVQPIYKKSGSDQIFLLELAIYPAESTTKQVTQYQTKRKTNKKEIVGLPRPRGQGKGSFILLYPTKCRSVTRLTQPSALSPKRTNIKHSSFLTAQHPKSNLLLHPPFQHSTTDVAYFPPSPP